MAHVGTQDLAAALVDARAKADEVRSLRRQEQRVAEFYVLQPEGKPVEPDVFPQARKLRDAWRRERYSRLANSE
jgi:hypothetical protein